MGIHALDRKCAPCGAPAPLSGIPTDWVIGSPTSKNSREGSLAVLRHVVLMRWKPGTSDAQKQAVREGLAALPAAIPQIRSYQFGDDAAIVEGNFEFAIVADFDNRSDFQTYAADDTHQKLIAKRIRPILQDRGAVQYEI